MRRPASSGSGRTFTARSFASGGGFAAWLVAALSAGIAAASTAELPTLEAAAADGRTVRGLLRSLSPEVVIANDEGEQRFSWDELLSLSFEGGPQATAPPVESVPMVLGLTDGSEFAARILTGGAATLDVQLAGGATISIDKQWIRTCSASAAGSSARALFESVRAERDALEDAVVLTREGRAVAVRGAVQKIDPHGVGFAWQQRELTLPWDKIAGLSLARPTVGGATVALTTRIGDRFCGRVDFGDDGHLTFSSRAIERLTLPWSDVQRIESLAARVLYLSALTPLSFESTSALGRHWPLGTDASLSGAPLRLGGQTHARGLAVHSRGRVAYEIGGAFRMLAGKVGVCDDAGPRGNVELAIVGDGRTLWTAESVRAGDSPRDIAVDVSGVRVLELMAEFGDGLDFGDHVCWAEVRLSQ